MATKENKLIQLFYPNVQWKLGQEDCLDRAERCVLIADDFAIGFAEWCIESEGKEYNKYKYRNRKELLEIYKKTL
jgi:hypothetical protein